MAKAAKAKAKRSHKPKTAGQNPVRAVHRGRSELGIEETGDGFENNFGRRPGKTNQIRSLRNSTSGFSVASPKVESNFDYR